MIFFFGDKLRNMESRVSQTATTAEFINMTIDAGMLCKLDDDIKIFARPVDAVIILATAVCILAANVLNFAVLTTTPSLCNVHGYLLTALTAGGFGLGCLAAWTVYPVWAGCWPYGETACRVCAYFVQVLAFLNTCVINLLNCERYVAICHPLKYTAWVTKKRTFGVIFVSLFVSFTPLIPLMITDQLNYIFVGSGYICIAQTRDAENLSLPLVFACIVTIPSFVIVVMTGFAMLRRLTRRSWQLHRLLGFVGDGSRRRQSRVARRNARLLVVSVLIILIYVICWIPLSVINIVTNSPTSGSSNETPWFALLSLWLALFVSPMCNTAIYMFMMDAFRARAKMLLTAFCCKMRRGLCCTQNEHMLSSTTEVHSTAL